MGCRIDLIVEFRSRKCREFPNVFTQPSGSNRKKHFAGLKTCCLCAGPPDLVISWQRLKTVDTGNSFGAQILNQLGTGGSVFDQNVTRVVKETLLRNGAF